MLKLSVVAILAWATMAHGQALDDKALLGKFIFFDKGLSQPTRQACADCHLPAAGWAIPEPGKAKDGPHPGAVQQASGARRPVPNAYITLNIPYNEAVPIGGALWDGRAEAESGIIGDPAVAQAKLPFTNPVEMNLKDSVDLCQRIAAAKYASLFEAVFGPILCDNGGADQVHDDVAEAIVAYESSHEVAQFSSRYDDWANGEGDLTPQELEGLDLVAANCGCHGFDTSDPETPFTTFLYFNVGVPKNVRNPVYKSDPGFVDLGLGGITGKPEHDGLFKVPSLRNVDKRPGKGFTKAFFHNGSVQSLEDVVRFYNARNAIGIVPEVADNVINAEGSPGGIGNLGLDDAQVDAIVAFLQALSDRDRVSPPRISDLKVDSKDSKKGNKE